MFHLSWHFLHLLYITLICVAAPVMSFHGKLCAQSISLASVYIHRIRTPLNHRTPTSSIYSQCSRDVAKLLILCNFFLVVMIICLGGTFTSNFLNFISIDARLLSLSDIPANPGETLHDLPALQHLFRQHISFKDSFQSTRKDIMFRNHYNNHRAFDPCLSSIHEKSSTDIQKS